MFQMIDIRLHTTERREYRFQFLGGFSWSSLLQMALQWRHNGRDSVSNHQPHDCFLNRLLRRRSKKTSKLRIIGLCAGNSPVTGEFPTQMVNNAENVSIWWRHHGIILQTTPLNSCVIARLDTRKNNAQCQFTHKRSEIVNHHRPTVY